MDDPRLTPARPDLAAKHLEGKVKADSYVDGEDYEISEALGAAAPRTFAGCRIANAGAEGRARDDL